MDKEYIKLAIAAHVEPLLLTIEALERRIELLEASWDEFYESQQEEEVLVDDEQVKVLEANDAVDAIVGRMLQEELWFVKKIMNVVTII